MQTVILNQRYLTRLTEKVESLRKRAVLIGLTEPRMTVLRQWDEKDKKGRVWPMAEVEIEAPVVRLDGWHFAAKVEAIIGTADGSENIVKRCAGYEGDLPPVLRTTGTQCDHCHTARPRLAVYALTHDDGRWIQVGRNCLRDFLGHPDAERLAEFLAQLSQLFSDEWARRDDEDDDYDVEGFRGGAFTIAVSQWLTFVAAAVEAYGWLSVTKAREFEQPSTSSRTFDGMFAKDKQDRLHPTEQNATDANAAVDWAKALGGDEPHTLSDYLWNVRTLAHANSIGFRNLGLAASILQTWRRETGQLPDADLNGKTRPPSEWQGVVGQRAEFTLTVIHVAEYDTQFGLMHLTVADDPAGNTFVWRSGNTLGDVGETVRVKASVKAHDEFRGRKQTVITRAKVIETIAPVEENGNAHGEA
jgi:hypothetical protein